MPHKKIVSVATLKKYIRYWRKRGKKIAFTNGCFDIIHAGHISYLKKAQRNGRILIVGLNSDKSVRSIKGPMRPINRQEHRAEVLAAIRYVDYVVLFNEDTPYQLIDALQPDILIKGADWKRTQVVGSDIVSRKKGSVELAKVLPGCSTSNIIKKIVSRCGK